MQGELYEVDKVNVSKLLCVLVLLRKIAQGHQGAPASLPKSFLRLRRVCEDLIEDPDIQSVALDAVHAAEKADVDLGLAWDRASGLSGFDLALTYSRERDKNRGGLAVPESASALALELLSVHDGEALLDLSCGTGGFLVSAALSKARFSEANTEGWLLGCDREISNVKIAKLRMALADSNATITCQDGFMYSEKSEKVFVTSPLEGGIGDFELGVASVSSEFPIASRLSSASKAGWLDVLKALTLMKSGGKTVAIIPMGMGFRGGFEADVRRELVYRGLLEAVIELPAGLFPHAGTNLLLCLFSEGNESVMMIDAADKCERGRRSVSMTPKNIAEVLAAVASETEFSHQASHAAMRAHGFEFLPSKYLAERVEIHDGVSLKELAISFDRGANIGAAELEEMDSDEETGAWHLMIQNIEDGMVVPPLNSLRSVDARMERYCVQDGDLVLSAIGPNYKMAVVDVPSGTSILASGNMYILRFDKDKVDPLYVQAYLNSEKGKSQLASFTQSSRIPRLSVKDLKRIKVPWRGIDEQRQIGQRFKQVLVGIAEEKEKLAKMRKEAESLFS